MSLELRQKVISLVRDNFTMQELLDVRPYAGEFDADESTKTSYASPAVFVSVLGWRPIKTSARLVGKYLRRVHMAAFVVTSHASRDGRGDEAMRLADRLALLLEGWTPTDTELARIARLDDGCTVENLYSRQMDTKKQALWMVSWTQDVQPLKPPGELFDLLAIDIVDHVRRSEPNGTEPPPVPPKVTEDVQFVPDEPAP